MIINLPFSGRFFVVLIVVFGIPCVQAARCSFISFCLQQELLRQRVLVMFKEYIIKNGKKLRCGITTGTCAAAAAAAATRLLLGAGSAEAVDLRLPGGDTVRVDTVERSLANCKASCCVRKYSGDDPDVTDGILIWADASSVSYTHLTLPTILLV